MKKCPFCAEDIQDAAVVCRYCHRDLQPVAKATDALQSALARYAQNPPGVHVGCPRCGKTVKTGDSRCAACGQELPTAFSTSARQNRAKLVKTFAGLAVVVVLGFVVAIVKSLPPSNEGCALHLRAAVVGRDAPVFQATGAPSGVLAVRSLDPYVWSNVELTLRGFERTGTQGSRPTGPYIAKKPQVGANGIAAVTLSDFQTATGARWIDLTMTASDLHVEAIVNGTRCAADVEVSK